MTRSGPHARRTSASDDRRPWNQFRGDGRNSAHRPDLEGPERLEEGWSVDLAAPATCSPVCWRETVLVGTERALSAFDARGARRWTLETDAAVAGTPIATSDRAFVATRDGAVFALEPSAGDVLWEYAATGPLESSLAAADGRLFVGDARGLAALDVETGERVWYRETGDAEDGSDSEADDSPSDVDDVETASDSDRSGEIGAETDATIELETASRARTDTRSNAPVVGCPAIVDRRASANASSSGGETNRDGDRDRTRPWDHDRVVIATRDGTVRALAVHDGTEVWRAPTDGTVVDGPTVVGDRVYTADDAGTLLALDADTGQSWFAYQSGTTFTTGPTVLADADAAFVGAADEYLHAVETTFGKRKLRGLLFSKNGVSVDGAVTTGPVVVGDILCVGDSSGTLYGIGVDDDRFADFVWHHPTDGVPTHTPAVAPGRLYVTVDDRMSCFTWAGE